MLDSSISTEFYMYWEKVSKWKKKLKKNTFTLKKDGESEVKTEQCIENVNA